MKTLAGIGKLKVITILFFFFIFKVDVNLELSSTLISFSTKEITTNSLPRRVSVIDEIYASCKFACFAKELTCLKMHQTKKNEL